MSTHSQCFYLNSDAMFMLFDLLVIPTHRVSPENLINGASRVAENAHFYEAPGITQ